MTQNYLIFFPLDDAGNVLIWSLEDYSLLQSWRDENKSCVQGIIWHHDHVSRRALCVVAHRNGTLRVWSRSRHEVIRVQPLLLLLTEKRSDLSITRIITHYLEAE